MIFFLRLKWTSKSTNISRVFSRTFLVQLHARRVRPPPAPPADWDMTVCFHCARQAGAIRCPHMISTSILSISIQLHTKATQVRARADINETGLWISNCASRWGNFWSLGGVYPPLLPIYFPAAALWMRDERLRSEWMDLYFMYQIYEWASWQAQRAS